MRANRHKKRSDAIFYALRSILNSSSNVWMSSGLRFLVSFLSLGRTGTTVLFTGDAIAGLRSRSDGHRSTPILELDGPIKHLIDGYNNEDEIHTAIVHIILIPTLALGSPPYTLHISTKEDTSIVSTMSAAMSDIYLPVICSDIVYSSIDRVYSTKQKNNRSNSTLRTHIFTS